MIPEAKLKIPFAEMSENGAKILAKQSETSFVKAFQQAQELNKSSNVELGAKKGRLFC